MKNEIKKITGILKQINKSKNIIASERDKLRLISGELFDCIESFDEGVEELNVVKQYMESTIDSLSEYVLNNVFR